MACTGLASKLLNALAVTISPNAQIAPRWVFTPWVVCNMVASPKRPISPIASRKACEHVLC